MGFGVSGFGLYHKRLSTPWALCHDVSKLLASFFGLPETRHLAFGLFFPIFPLIGFIRTAHTKDQPSQLPTALSVIFINRGKYY